jgi:hypothetical protein
MPVLGEAKVDEGALVVLIIPEHVVTLHIAVNDAQGMTVLERLKACTPHRMMISLVCLVIGEDHAPERGGACRS